ncbi:MAG: hypothetical protein PHP05_03420 [Sideroxydans sp.]|nr:hypothetical protein [Sideroxydans sp.]
MAIKQNPVLTKEDFESALVTQRLSVSEVARQTGIPRHIVSHFRNYGDGLKPEQATTLRDYLEGLGVEFTEAESESAAPAGSPHGLRLPAILSDDGLTQRTALVCRHFFIDERISDGQIEAAGERILESFEEAKELMDVKLESRAFSSDYDEATDTKLRELWSHLARIGLVSLHMQGRVLFGQARFTNPQPISKPTTIGDLLFNTYHEALAIGLHQTEPEVPAEEVEA